MQVCKIGCIDCVHANSHYCTLLAWSMVRVRGSSDETLARKSAYSWPVTGCKSGVRARIYTASHKPNTIVVRSLVVSCWSCIRMLIFVSGGLLTYF